MMIKMLIHANFLSNPFVQLRLIFFCRLAYFRSEQIASRSIFQHFYLHFGDVLVTIISQSRNKVLNFENFLICLGIELQ